MSDDLNACFSPTFVAQLDQAVQVLPSDYQKVTWASSEKGMVAALVGPASGSFVIAVEEGLVILMQKPAGQKLETWPVAQVTGDGVVRLMQDALDAGVTDEGV